MLWIIMTVCAIIFLGQLAKYVGYMFLATRQSEYYWTLFVNELMGFGACAVLMLGLLIMLFSC